MVLGYLTESLEARSAAAQIKVSAYIILNIIYKFEQKLSKNL